MRAFNVRKPTRHHNLESWQRNNENIQLSTSQDRENASGIRFNSQQLRSEVLNKIHSNKEDTNAKLTDRIIDIERLHLQISQSLRQVEEHIISVSEAKKAVENAHSSKFPFTLACKRSLDIREERRYLELVNDFVNNALTQESQCLQLVTKQLREKGMELWNKLCSLKEIQDNLKNDLKAKGKAAKEDTTARAMNTHSPNTTFKLLPTDPPSSIVTEMQWADRSLSNKKQAEKVLEESQDSVCEAFALIRRTENEVLQHREKTAECMRRRIHQVQSARDLLKIQKEQLLEELPKMSIEVMDLEKTVDSTRAPLKLVHTRLEHRKWHPSIEVCSDGPRRALTKELREIELVKGSLVEKLQTARVTLNKLQFNLVQVERDLEKKENALGVENKSMEVHAHPLVGDQAFQWMQPREDTDNDRFYSEIDLEESQHQNDRLTLYRPRPKDSLTIGLKRNSTPSNETVQSEWKPAVVNFDDSPRAPLPDVVVPTLSDFPESFLARSDVHTEDFATATLV